MGAVTTTFIAAWKPSSSDWLSPSVQSPSSGYPLSGKRRRAQSQDRDFVPPWPDSPTWFSALRDIFEENGYEAAKHAGVLTGDAGKSARSRWRKSVR
jgi:hypothetical protein